MAAEKRYVAAERNKRTRKSECNGLQIRINLKLSVTHIFVEVLKFLLRKFNYVDMYHRYLICRYLFYIILLFICEYIHKVETFIVIHTCVHSRARTQTHILGSCIYDKSFYCFNFAYNCF